MPFLDLVGSRPSDFPAFAYVETTFGPGNRVSGSGTLIGPRLVLTAGHVVFDPDARQQASEVFVRFGNNASFVTTEVDFPLEYRDAAPGSLEFSALSGVDVGVIVLPAPVDPSGVPIIPVQTASDDMLSAMSINVAGFPTHPPDTVGGERGEFLCGRNCNLILGAALQAMGLAGFGPTRLFYPVATLEGMSGGPVYKFDPEHGRTLHGVHTSGPTPSSPNFPGSALRITTGIFLTIQEWIGKYQP